MNDQELRATLLANGPYGRDGAPYKLLEVAGPDAGAFLQRLCAQDVLNLAEGAVAPAAFLDAKGKLQFTVLVVRRGEAFWLETHAEQFDGLSALIERYHFTEKLAIRAVDLGAVHETITAGDGLESGCAIAGDGDATRIELRFVRRGVRFTRIHGATGEVAGAALTPELAEAVRMTAGLVRVGIETEASTLALEADLDDHCSTSKGCYTGQEIVARIHTYGHVNRKLCLLLLPMGDAVDEPIALHEVEDDIPVGRVMHAVAVAEHGVRVGLGYLPKDFQEIGTKLTLAGEGDVEVIGFAPAVVD